MSDWNPEHQSAWAVSQSLFPDSNARHHRERTREDSRQLTIRAAAIRKRDERIAELEAEAVRLQQFEPTLHDGEMRQLICAPIELDWHAVIAAIADAADQMVDCEEEEQLVEMPDESWLFVDFADGRALNPSMNIVRVREATKEEVSAALAAGGGE